MKEITIDLLKTAFRKLLTATYYDKTDMVQRLNVASFAKRLATEEEKVFNELLSVSRGENKDLLQKWLRSISLKYYPKKVRSKEEENAHHVITNIPPKAMIAERLLVKADIPTELCVLDVAWLLLYGFKVDGELQDGSCFGNRLDLMADKGGVRNGNALFRKYQNQYKAWWGKGIKEANTHLKQKEDVSIINFDISNCYHSIDFDFEEFLSSYDRQWPEDSIEKDPLTIVIIKTYQRYWEVTKSSNVEVFYGNNEGKRPLPLTLSSAHLLANWYLSPLDEFILRQYHPLYYGRYVDDCMVVVKTKSDNSSLVDSIEKELPGLMKFEDDKATFAIAKKDDADVLHRLASFELQQDKLFVYRFNCLLPQTSIDDFVQGQIERSSEFRFLTDDADTSNVNLENVTLVNTFDAEEEPGRRFSILEESRYKLTVYLAKLATKLAKYGADYKRYDEVEKVHQYFTDGLLIKHYQLWERLMTVYVLAGRKDYVRDLVQTATQQIESLKVKDNLFLKDVEQGRQIIVQSLLFHLEQSETMAISLNKGDDRINMLYLDTFMIRMHYNQLPLQEFSFGFDREGVLLRMGKMQLREELYGYQWMPYYVKYYAIVSALSIGNIYHPDVYSFAFDIYCKLNHVGRTFDWMAFLRSLKKDYVSEFNVDLSNEPLWERNRTVAVVEMDMDDKDTLVPIDHFGEVYSEKIRVFDSILDKITKIRKADIFVLPELSLPIYELMGYCLYSSRKEVAFVAGLEYVVKNDVVYNYLVTSLPITLYGQHDAIPIIRLKNHYAPQELKCIVKEKGKKVPAPSPVWQILYHWHGHVFTSYYCYELTSIKERSFFFSAIDAMYCPVFNKDTYYFNNIAESTARDMHCFFVLSNVSHYGDSRVTKPASHVVMNMLKVKGGNTIDNKAVVLSAELDVKALREFQLLNEEQQRDDKRFKSTPPGYNKEMVRRRARERFIYDLEDDMDSALSNIAEIGMKY